MKKLIIKLIIVFIPTILLGGLIVVVDPFFHYRKPMKSFGYEWGDNRWINDGILRNFDYDAVMLGTSYDEYGSLADFNEAFHVDAVKVIYPGANPVEYGRAMETAFANNDHIKLMFFSINYGRLTSGTNEWYEGYDYPFFLYDNNYLNDWKYIFNLSTVEFARRGIRNTIQGREKMDFSTYYDYSGIRYGREYALAAYDSQLAVPYESHLTDQMRKNEKENIEKYFVKFILENPNTEFVLYFPPMSALNWASRSEEDWDETMEIIEMAFRELTQYENVRLYSYIDELTITTNLDYYKDVIHYSPEINSLLFRDIQTENHLVTATNYQELINRIRETYRAFDYETILN